MGCETYTNSRLHLGFQSVYTNFLYKNSSQPIYVSLKGKNKFVSDIKVSVEEIYIETSEYKSLIWIFVWCLGYLL